MTPHRLIPTAAWPRRIAITLGVCFLILAALVITGLFLGDVGFFLRWVFGFQADD